MSNYDSYCRDTAGDDTSEAAGDAAAYNERVLRKLLTAVARQPDLDLSSALPPQYQSKLASKRQRVQAADGANPIHQTVLRHSPPSGSAPEISAPPKKFLSSIDVSLPASVLYPLSATVESMLGEEEPQWSESGLLSLALSGILRSAKVIFQSETDHSHFVARCSDHIAVKAVSTADSTEYTTLKFLESQSPAILAPKPHGVITVGNVWYMFMSLVPGASLESVWQGLTDSQKRSVSSDLDKILLRVHNIPFEHGSVLGGVAGQGCKDTRRHSRVASAAIHTSEALWEFMYGFARNKDTVYGKFLRQQTFPRLPQRIVFIHGDIRPANIMVRRQEGARVEITGLVDWELIGFYPEGLECIKALNNMSPLGTDDWYLFLPECISPRSHLESWHTDVMWDPYVA